MHLFPTTSLFSSPFCYFLLASTLRPKRRNVQMHSFLTPKHLFIPLFVIFSNRQTTRKKQRDKQA